MKANEFRISDFVASLRYNSIVQDEEGKLFRVVGVDTFNCKVMTSADDTWYSGDIFYPIPLTEEWLLKFGFETDEKIIYYLGDFSIMSDSEMEWSVQLYIGVLPSRLNGRGTKYKGLKYVHQLQNLYFALTGEELTTK